jgi:radical SAM protein (TIGR01212 family)
LRQHFARRVHRVTVDGGFTCPNADGTVAIGGCVYCDNRSFSPARRLPAGSIAEQVHRGIAQLQQRMRVDAFLAYFQAATNTYAPVPLLRQLYDEAVAHPQVIGLVVGTRPDCVPGDVLDLLESYADRRFVAVEYGLQSVHQRSLDWMNRGHDVACFFDAVERTKGRNIDVSAHVILGLPGERLDDMLATADALAAAGVDGVKIHNLHVVRNTPLERAFRRGRVTLLEEEEYLEVLIAFLERLPARMVVHRVTGDAPPDYLVAPRWVVQKAAFLQRLDQELRRRDTWQGKRMRAE